MSGPLLPRLPFWMDGPRARALAAAAQTWFALLGRGAMWAPDNADPMTCPEELLDLIAWQRGINRYSGEPDRLYRLRVHHAYANGVDAGSVAGWGRIFERLELGAVSLEERVAGQDWDCIGVVLDDAQFAAAQDAFEIIVNEYGRTCRRYHFISRIPVLARASMGIFDNHHNTVYATARCSVKAACRTDLNLFDNDHNTMEAVWV